MWQSQPSVLGQHGVQVFFGRRGKRGCSWRLPHAVYVVVLLVDDALPQLRGHLSTRTWCHRPSWGTSNKFLYFQWFPWQLLSLLLLQLLQLLIVIITTIIIVIIFRASPCVVPRHPPTLSSGFPRWPSERRGGWKRLLLLVVLAIVFLEPVFSEPRNFFEERVHGLVHVLSGDCPPVLQPSLLASRSPQPGGQAQSRRSGRGLIQHHVDLLDTQGVPVLARPPRSSTPGHARSQEEGFSKLPRSRNSSPPPAHLAASSCNTGSCACCQAVAVAVAALLARPQQS
mmetsp:Transcript_69994/g.126120  ORF Transcript_69994/g.126120 Transcript_69994/m.126120 type:complete len:284 (-) Transcript_69994:204-1055(-)